MSKVALVKGENRKEIIFKSLNLLKQDITKSIKNKQIIIKPNLVSKTNQLAATHVGQIKAILNFFNFYKKKIIIAEASALGNTFDGYKNFNYLNLKNNYNVEFIDLNQDDYEIIEVNPTLKVKVSKTLVNKNNYVISAARMKTHDAVVATLSLKNIVMGAILTGDKGRMHQGIRQININLFNLAKILKPDLAVIDAFISMEGNGPCHGTPIKTKTSIASLDFLAADRVGLEIMGIDPNKVGYLCYCAKAGLGEYNLNNIQIIGNKIQECKTKFKLHSTIQEQFKWKT